jgi:hypothetical protein
MKKKFTHSSTAAAEAFDSYLDTSQQQQKRCHISSHYVQLSGSKMIYDEKQSSTPELNK